MAVKSAILTFTRMHRRVQFIHLQIDNIVALSCLVKMGRTQSEVSQISAKKFGTTYRPRRSQLHQTTFQVSSGNTVILFTTFTLLQLAVRIPLLLPKSPDLLLGPNKKKQPLIEQGNLQLLAWTISVKDYMKEEFQKSLPLLSQVPQDEV